MACNPDEGSSVLFIQPSHETEGFALCCLNAKSGNNCVLQHEFGPEDSPLLLWTKGRPIHVTGNWIWELDEDEEGECGGCSDEECDINHTAESEEDVAVIDFGDIEPIAKKRARDTNNDVVETQIKSSSEVEKKTGRNKRGKSAKDQVPPNEEIVTVSKPPEDDGASRKKWKIKPQNDEGVSVPKPKQRTLSSGVLITDHVIGKGSGPRLGSIVSITYDGLFPDGQIFDSNQRRSQPLKFRLGAGQVVLLVYIGVPSS
jgi:FKBP-type peptidyl-prolyl cis-trans isomerase